MTALNVQVVEIFHEIVTFSCDMFNLHVKGSCIFYSPLRQQNVVFNTQQKQLNTSTKPLKHT